MFHLSSFPEFYKFQRKVKIAFQRGEGPKTHVVALERVAVFQKLILLKLQ